MSAAPNPVPLRLGPDSEFAALRTALLANGYTDAAVCERLHLKRISELYVDGKRELGEEPPDKLGLLVRLLIEGGAVSRSAAASLPMQELLALGVVTPVGPAADLTEATVMLYPTRGLYIVSDHTMPREGWNGPPPEDIVYPAIIPNTDLFLDLLPRTPCDALLDLCSGTGIAALAAAHEGSRHAWAFDITARSTHFGEFNRRLNGLSNVTVARGDLYEPAGDATFDRIVVHPPYVPVYRPQFIFDSGGEDGEQIVRRVIEGLPRYLRPGGRFYGLTMGTDRERPFEERVRQWMGPEEGEFDVALVVRRTLAPREYAADSVVRTKGAASDIASWRGLFEQLGVRALVYGLLIVQRRESARPVFTVRRQKGDKSGPAEHAWLMEWETAVIQEEDRLLAARVRASKHARLRIEHSLSGGNWVPELYHLEADYPFLMEMRVQAWMPYLLSCVDGSQTTADLLERLKSDGAIHLDTPPREFARALAVLVSGGFLEIDEFRLPVE